MDFYLYNTLSRKKELFQPIFDKSVGFYTCGPTVYDYPHIGNMRAYIVSDILDKALKDNGYNVKHVMNITDVGHLTSDADMGEDKLVKALKREGKELNWDNMIALSRYYTDIFFRYCDELNISKPDVICKATDYIHEMIELIKKIEKNGFAYKTSVGLIFDTSKFSDYAKLGRLNLSGQEQGARTEADKERKNPADFALWVTNQPNHIMQWDSPWGKGFPGWHIECSAMSAKNLGNHFDIHSGGVDHIPVHHTNEIAQSEAANKEKFVNYWVHNEYLILDKGLSRQAKAGKMSKSAGDFITLDALVDKGFTPLAFRYLCLMTHYRNRLQFSWESLAAAQKTLDSIYELGQRKSEKASEKDKNEILKAINNDLDTPKALAILHKKNNFNLWLEFESILGLGLKQEKIALSENEKELIRQREEARKNKNFKKADEIRQQLLDMGIKVEDTASGTQIIK